MGRKYLPANPTRVLGRRFKWKEALFNALTFGLLIGCIEAYSHDVSHTTILAGAVCLLFVGVQYVRMQLHDKYPMLPFDLLKIPAFSLSVVTSVLSFTMTSWPLVIVFVAPMAGWLVGKVHPGILGGIGLTIMSAGCFLLAFVPVDTTPLGLVWRLMLCGMGFGFFQSPNNHMLLSSAPPHRTGSASGMLATARLLGQTTGAALVALLFHLFGDTAPHDAMLLAGVLTLCGAFSSVTRLKLV